MLITDCLELFFFNFFGLLFRRKLQNTKKLLKTTTWVILRIKNKIKLNIYS